MEAPMTLEEQARQDRGRAMRSKNTRSSWGKVAWACWTLTLIQVSVFIAELVRNSLLTGSPIETQPNVNPMIGPSTWVLINMGARYVPCIKDPSFLGVTPTTNWPCPNTTTSDLSSPMMQCTLSELCGLGAMPDQYPVTQWFRFITPIFLHAGFIHIGFNMLMQMTLGREIEHLIGTWRFLIVYFSSGIFGFVLGANYAQAAIASMGASGCLFGLTAISLLDLLYTWGKRKNPKWELGLIVAETLVTLVLGLLPGVDNFSHIGGLLMGTVLGICLLRSPAPLRMRITRITDRNDHGAAFELLDPVEDATNGSVEQQGKADSKQRAQVISVKEFAAAGTASTFTNRKPMWWFWWLVRAGALVAVVVIFIVLINNFYSSNNRCTWCRYLSCLPVKNWCDMGLDITSTSSNSTSRRLM